MGTIKYFGTVPFGVNLWYGVELDEPTGKHDGCVGGVRYFTCPPNRGLTPSSINDRLIVTCSSIQVFSFNRLPCKNSPLFHIHPNENVDFVRSTSLFWIRAMSPAGWTVVIYSFSGERTSYARLLFSVGLKRDSSADDRLTEQYQVDDRVSLSKNRHGTVKYVGSTSLGSGTLKGRQHSARFIRFFQVFGTGLNWMLPMVCTMGA